MPKRKWNETRGPARDPLAKQRGRAANLISHGAIELQHAIKVAKSFERPKLNRRLKQASDKNKTDEKIRLLGEIEALKNLETAPCAEAHLYKILLKIKSIAQHAALPESVTVEKSSIDPHAANVTARLYNYPVTKKTLGKVLNDVREALDLEKVEINKDKKLKQKQSSQAERNEGTQPRQQQDDFTGPDIQDDIDYAGDDMNDIDHEKLSHRFDDLADLDSDAQSEQFELMEQRIVASSDSDSESDHDHGSESSFPLIRHKGRSISRSPPQSPPQKSETSNPQKDDTPTQKPKPRLEPDAPSEQTYFVPSLQVGYISDSDSSATDVEEDVAPRKNRRGQRARQAIWEKKYGSGAKHVRRERVQQQRDAGWDPKRGAMGDGDGPYWKRKMMGTVGGANAEPISKPRVLGQPAPPEKGMHPSWVAKQKAKETQGAEFKGTKMVFD